MGKGLTLVLLLAILGGINGSQTVFSVFFNEISACLLEQQIHPVAHSDETVRIILSVSQNETGFVRVMECVNKKVMAYTYNSSASPTHRFLTKIFDGQHQKLVTLAQIVNDLYRYTPKDDFSCIAKETSMSNLFDDCLTDFDSRNALQDLHYACSAYGQYGKTRSCLETNSLYSKHCSHDVSEMAAVFADVLFTKCDEHVSVYSNVTVQSSPYSFHLVYSAFVTCGEVAFPNTPLELMYLFPPSEFSIMTIPNFTKQTFRQQQINELSRFCSNVHEYAECVKQKIIDGDAHTDIVLSMFIDGKNFENTMAKYCKNQNLVTSQFSCMVDSVNKTRCNGGVLDILQFIFQIPSDKLMGFAYSCSDIHKRKQCRIDKQLSVCEPQFAALMEETMNNLLTPDCRKGDYVIPRNIYSATELTSCMAEYYMGWSVRIHNQSDTFDDPSLIADFVITEMGHFCAAYDKMFDCMDQKIKTSETMIDVIIRKYAPLKSIRGLLRYLCGKKEVIKNNLRCLMLEISSVANRKDSCVNSLGNEYEDMASEFSNISTVEDMDIEKIRKVTCPMANAFGSCFKPSFDKCSAEAGDMLDTLVDYFYNSCMDPKYEIKSEGQTGGGNGTGPMISVMLMLLMSLLGAL